MENLTAFLRRGREDDHRQVGVDRSRERSCERRRDERVGRTSSDFTGGFFEQFPFDWSDDRLSRFAPDRLEDRPSRFVPDRSEDRPSRFTPEHSDDRRYRFAHEQSDDRRSRFAPDHPDERHSRFEPNRSENRPSRFTSDQADRISSGRSEDRFISDRLDRHEDRAEHLRKRSPERLRRRSPDLSRDIPPRPDSLGRSDRERHIRDRSPGRSHNARDKSWTDQNDSRTSSRNDDVRDRLGGRQVIMLENFFPLSLQFKCHCELIVKESITVRLTSSFTCLDSSALLI